MKSNFKQQLILALATPKKNQNKGFTLIELLVVIIIIGILSAVALPNLLGQVGQARETEARQNMGALIRGQQAYRVQNGTFAGTQNQEDYIDNLNSALGISIQATAYSYGVSDNAVNSQQVTMHALPSTDFDNDIRNFQAALLQPAGGTGISIVCQDEGAGVARADASLAAVTIPTDLNDPLTCANNFEEAN